MIYKYLLLMIMGYYYPIAEIELTTQETSKLSVKKQKNRIIDYPGRIILGLIMLLQSLSVTFFNPKEIQEVQIVHNDLPNQDETYWQQFVQESFDGYFRGYNLVFLLFKYMQEYNHSVKDTLHQTMERMFIKDITRQSEIIEEKQKEQLIKYIVIFHKLYTEYHMKNMKAIRIFFTETTMKNDNFQFNNLVIGDFYNNPYDDKKQIQLKDLSWDNSHNNSIFFQYKNIYQQLDETSMTLLKELIKTIQPSDNRNDKFCHNKLTKLLNINQ